MQSTTPVNDDGLYGCYGWSAGYERRGVGDHQHGALRACMASWTDGDAESAVLPLMKRADGILLAMPAAFLPQESVLAGNRGDEGAMFGPSLRCTVPSVILDGGAVSPTGTDVDVLVVDCLPSLLYHM